MIVANLRLKDILSTKINLSITLKLLAYVQDLLLIILYYY